MRSRPQSATSVGPDRKLYVVATVHLDTQWRWTIQDTIREFLPATLERNFEIFARHPFFVVSFEGAFRYQLLKEYYPEAFETLRRWVERGRWRVAGSMLDSPDVNVVHPESLLRHILYGNGFFERELGVRSRDLFLPDCFGFGFALPSIAAHCGLLGFSGQKFGRWMAPATIPFDVGVWQGPDGAGIVAAIRPEGYGEGLDEDLSRAPRFVERLDLTGRQSGVYVGIKYVGVGDRGGGLDEASVEWLARSVNSGGPVQVVLSGSDQLFLDLDPAQIAALPRYSGELLLPTHGTGCLTSQALLKRWNRRNEQLADAAERAAAMAEWLTAMPYPDERLERAWTRFLWHQMHDDLTGTSIPAAYRFTDNDELLSLNEFASILTDSIGALCSRMDSRCQGTALAVFNPLSREREDLVEVQLTPGEASVAAFRVVDPDGIEVPSQRIETATGPALLFSARVGPLGLEIFDLQTGTPATGPATELDIGPRRLINHRYQVEIGPDGDVAQIHDRVTDRDLLGDPVRMQLLHDRSARWPAWEILYRDLLDTDPPTLGGPADICIVEHGPVRVAIQVVRRYRRSTFRQIIRLAASGAGERLEIFNEIDWYTRGRLLKVAFPAAAANPLAVYDLGLGVIERGNNRREKHEVPAQQWAAIPATDSMGGISILNDCKYGWDKPDDRTLRLSLLRSPRVLRKFRHQGRQDHGRHRFSYAVCGHLPDWQPTDTTWQAARLNQPLLAFRTASHPGDLGRRIAGLSLSSEQVSVQALKRGRHGGRWVARLRELGGQNRERVAIRLPLTVTAATRVDGMEEPIEVPGDTDRVEGGGIVTGIGAFGLTSLAFELSDRTPSPADRSQLPIELDFDVVSTTSHRSGDRLGFDGRGHSIPAELWPGKLTVGAIDFNLGPTTAGAANALSCRGQTIELGSHGFDRLHFLAASTTAPVQTVWQAGHHRAEFSIGQFSGLVGGRPHIRGGFGARRRHRQPRLADRLPVAWVGTHRHGPGGRDEPYVFCYLYRYRLVIPAGCDRLILPAAPAVRVFAITLSNDRSGDTAPAQPLYD